MLHARCLDLKREEFVDSSVLISADSGRSNGSRLRLWKRELAALAEQAGLEITVCHLPPGTSKWNRSSTGCSP
jgi:Rhodopirellula transposase DDE domain